MTGDEQLVLLLHPHWKTLIRPILIAVVVVAIALVAEALIPGGSGAVAVRGAVGAVAVLVLMVWLTVPVLRWRTTTYELTTKRLRTRFGIVTRRGRDIPLSRINDVSFERGVLDRLLGAGRLVVESAGEHGQIVLPRHPERGVRAVHAVPAGRGRTAAARTRPAQSTLAGRLNWPPCRSRSAPWPTGRARGRRHPARSRRSMVPPS